MTTRKEAIRNGLTRYNTGEPCKNGHFADRYTITSNCSECVKAYQKVSKARLNTNRMRSGTGYVNVTVRVRACDAQLIRDCAELANAWAEGTHSQDNVKLLIDYANALDQAQKLANP